MKLETTIIRTLLLIALIMGLYSCQFNKSVEKDLTTGAFLSGDGISTDNVVVEINGKAEKRNEFVFGEKVNLVFENVEGLTKKEGKMFPGLSMYIIKNEKDTVVSNADLLKNLDSGTAISPLELNANFMTALTSKNNEKYKVHVTIWDKNGTGTLRYELPFTVKESNLLTIKNSGLTFSNIYLWNETLQETVTTNKVNSDHLLILIMNGVEGHEGCGR